MSARQQNSNRNATAAACATSVTRASLGDAYTIASSGAGGRSCSPRRAAGGATRKGSDINETPAAFAEKMGA
jgi:hypothetical protein